MTVEYESVSVELSQENLVRITIVSVEKGVDVGGSLWLGKESVPWLVDALDKFLRDRTSSHTVIGPDALRVKKYGRDWEPMVGIGNARTGSVPRAGGYFISVLEDNAPRLLEQLRALTR